MKVFNYSSARQNLASLLNAALDEEVMIRRKDGTSFKVVSLNKKKAQSSPLDVPAIRTKASTEDVLEAVKDSRKPSAAY